jgi:hypothetical protein
VDVRLSGGGRTGAESDISKAAQPRNFSAFARSLFSNSYASAILCLAALLWVVSIFFFLRTRFDQVGPQCALDDFACYSIYAQAMRHGINPYQDSLNPVARFYHLSIKGTVRSGYPPTYVLSMELLTPLRFEPSYWVWTALNFASLLLCLYLLLYKILRLDVNTSLSLAALALFYQPIIVSFGWGQPHMILLLIMLGAWMCFRRDKDFAGGLILAYGGLLKIYPLFLVGYLVAKRKWWAIAYTAIGLVGGGIATIALLGVSRTLSFAGRLPDRVNGGWLASVHALGSPSLVNLDAFVSRTFWELTGTVWNGPGDWLRRLLVLSAQLALLALTFRETWRAPNDPRADLRAFGLWMALTALLAPTAWVHYMILLLVPLAVVAAAAIRGDAPSLATWLAAISFFLIVLVVPSDFLVSLPPHFSLIDYPASGFMKVGASFPQRLVTIVADVWFFALTILAYLSAYLLRTDCVDSAA